MRGEEGVWQRPAHHQRDRRRGRRMGRGRHILVGREGPSGLTDAIMNDAVVCLGSDLLCHDPVCYWFYSWDVRAARARVALHSAAVWIVGMSVLLLPGCCASCT